MKIEEPVSDDLLHMLAESEKDCKPKRFHVMEKIKVDPETHVGRGRYYAEFDTLEEAVDYINHSPDSPIGILDMNDQVDT